MEIKKLPDNQGWVITPQTATEHTAISFLIDALQAKDAITFGQARAVDYESRAQGG